jgi:hypothetical protein
MAEKTTQYDGDIQALEEQIDTLRNRLYHLRQLRAEELCPHKVGDIITDKKGKRTAKISSIIAGYGDYEMHGCLQKKDGSFSDYSRQLYWFEWE